jgi:hypothetical protein
MNSTNAHSFVELNGAQYSVSLSQRSSIHALSSVQSSVTTTTTTPN